jgi:hypothetical protein
MMTSVIGLVLKDIGQLAVFLETALILAQSNFRDKLLNQYLINPHARKNILC